jgi:hypothetical protein
MRQQVRFVGDMIDVEMHGAGKMPPAVLRAPIEVGADVVPGAIEDPKVRIGKVLGNPLGACQRIRIYKARHGA